MNCEHIRKNLFRYTGHDMPAEERSAVEDHLRTCAGCSVSVAGILSLESLIRKEKEAEPNPFAATRILRRLESEIESHAYRHRQKLVHLLQPALVAASLIIALLAGYMIGRYGGRNLNQSAAGNPREQIRSELFIKDFVDEDLTLLSNK